MFCRCMSLNLKIFAIFVQLQYLHLKVDVGEGWPDLVLSQSFERGMQTIQSFGQSKSSELVLFNNQDGSLGE